MMDSFKVKTFQNITLEYHFSDVTSRMLARLIDWAIELSWFLILLFVSILLEVSLNSRLSVVLSIVFALPVIFYSPLFEQLLDGQTPGKKIMKIKVMRLDGRSAGIGNYLLRWMFMLIDSILFVGVVLIATSKNHQRLGDMLAGTTVISLKGQAETMEPLQTVFSDDYQPVFRNVSVLTSHDILVLRQVVFSARKNKELTHTLLMAASEKVRALLGLNGARYEGQEFLETVIMDHAFLTDRLN